MAELGQMGDIYEEVLKRLMGESAQYSTYTDEAQQQDINLLSARLADPRISPEERARIRNAIAAGKQRAAAPKARPTPKPTPIPKPAKIPPMPGPLKQATPAPRKDWQTGQVIPPAPVVPLRPPEDKPSTIPMPSTIPTTGMKVKSTGAMPGKKPGWEETPQPTQYWDTPQSKGFGLPARGGGFTPSPSTIPLSQLEGGPVDADLGEAEDPGTPTRTPYGKSQYEAGVGEAPATLPTGKAKLEDEFGGSPQETATDFGRMVSDKLTGFGLGINAEAPTAEPAPTTDLGKQISGVLGQTPSATEQGATTTPPTAFPEMKPGLAGSFYASEPEVATSKTKKTTETEFVAPEQLESEVTKTMTAQEAAAENYRKAIAAYYGIGKEGESPYAKDVSAKEAARKAAYDQYLSRMERAPKAEMWDRIIGALGKITAGTVGLTGVKPAGIPAGLDVASAYKFTPTVDRGQLEASAAKLREAQEGRADEMFQMAKGRALEPAQAEFLSTLPPEQQMKFWEVFGKFGGGRTQTTEDIMEDRAGARGKVITPSQFHPSASGGGTQKLTISRAQQSEKAFGDEMSTLSGSLNAQTNAIPPNKANLTDNEYITSRSLPTRDRKDQLSRAFVAGLVAAKKKEGKKGAALYGEVDAIIRNVLSPVNLSPESKEYTDWYLAVEEADRVSVANNGASSSIRIRLPKVDHTIGTKTYDIYDIRQNPNSYYNQMKRQQQEAPKKK